MSGGGTIYTDMGGWQFTFIQHKEAGEIEFGQYIAPVIDAPADGEIPLRLEGPALETDGDDEVVIAFL